MLFRSWNYSNARRLGAASSASARRCHKRKASSLCRACHANLHCYLDQQIFHRSRLFHIAVFPVHHLKSRIEGTHGVPRKVLSISFRENFHPRFRSAVCSWVLKRVSLLHTPYLTDQPVCVSRGFLRDRRLWLSVGTRRKWRALAH